MPSFLGQLFEDFGWSFLFVDGLSLIAWHLPFVIFLKAADLFSGCVFLYFRDSFSELSEGWQATFCPVSKCWCGKSETGQRDSCMQALWGVIWFCNLLFGGFPLFFLLGCLV